MPESPDTIQPLCDRIAHTMSQTLRGSKIYLKPLPFLLDSRQDAVTKYLCRESGDVLGQIKLIGCVLDGMSG